MKFLGMATALLLVTLSANSFASDFSFSFGVSSHRRYYAPVPHYVAPVGPVYYYTPAPRVYYSPVYVAPPVYYVERRRVGYYYY